MAEAGASTAVLFRRSCVFEPAQPEAASAMATTNNAFQRMMPFPMSSRRSLASILE
jgi:hypothetical protein